MSINHYIIGAAVALIALLCIWLVLRWRANAPVQKSADPNRPRLEPRKPDIVLASAADFSATKSETVPASAASDRPRIAPAVEPTSGPADDLRRIKGLGPKLAAILGDLGVTRFDQIAAWSDADIAEIDAHLGQFAGRITRDAWVEQAAFLARGDEDGFKARFGAL